MLLGERYRVERVLKRGGVAELLEAVVEGEGGFKRRVAIKRLLPELAANEEQESYVRELIDEARISSALHHANIAAVHDFGVSDGTPFLVVELVDGPDLVGLRERARAVPEDVALFIAAEVAGALDYAHRAADESGVPLGIVHRDVSPENILVSWTGDVKLVDFGIAFAVSRLEATRVGIAKGKIDYMAPEQLQGLPVDGRADVYALGCTLHYLLTGRTAVPQIDRHLSADVVELIRRATRQERAGRFQSAAELAKKTSELLATRTKGDPRQRFRAWLGTLTGAATAAIPELAEMKAIDGLFDLQLLGQKSNTPPPTDPYVGSMLHGYKVTQLIGRGSFSRVYRAQHRVLPRAYAVKILGAESAEKPRTLKRFEREAKVLAELSHPNIVSIADFGTTPDGLPFMTMELIEGKTLDALISGDEEFSVARIISITRQLASGLAAAHAANLVHRDLKPSNVMVFDEGGQERVKILDFGSARFLDEELTRLTAIGGLVGTPAWAAPEQLEDSSTAEASADMYALGAIASAMIGEQHASELETLVVSLVSEDPSKRPTAAKVIELLDRARISQSGPGPKPTLPPAMTPPPTATATPLRTPARTLARAPVKRTTLPWWLAASTFVLALVLAFVAASRSNPKPAPIVALEPPVQPPPAIVPRAADELEVEPAEDLSERAPSERPRGAHARTKTAEKILDVPRERDANAELKAVLQERGLELEDLAHDPGFARLRAAARPNDAAAIDALLAHARAVDIDAATIGAKLDRIAALLESRAARLGTERAAALEHRYLDLRARAGARPNAAERASITRDAAALARDLSY